MCVICDGESFDSYAFRTLETIDRVGWSLVGVEAGPRGVGWTYTVGLSPTFDHPELVVVDLGGSDASLLLDTLGRAIEDGEEFDVGHTAEIGDHLFTFGWVHPRQFELGTFAVWSNVVEEAFVDRPRRAALQVVPPACLTVSDSRPERWLLNRPRRLLGGRVR
jgi:hypothetical protein